MPIEIIAAKAAQIDAAREVCKETAHVSFHGRFDVLNLMYLDYYILCQPENCYFAMDGDKVVGYILSAETSRFVTEYKRIYLPRLRRKSLRRVVEMLLEFKRAKRLQKQGFSHHLHIDITAAYQHHGLGTRLMDALVERLKATGSPGVYLEVYSDNEKAVSFYKKYGFVTQKRHMNYLVMGLKFK